MQSNYNPIGKYIRLVDNRNSELNDIPLVGVSIKKKFIPSVANTIGTNMKTYKLIKKDQFACSLMQVRRDGKIPVALFEDEEAIISQAYPVFEILDTVELLPQYLMMWMSRNEFDREACFYAVGGVRGSLEWEDFCNMQLPVPSVDKQKEIVKEYHTITDRIKLNEQLNQKLEDTTQSIYKYWFIDFEFPDENGKVYKSSGGKMIYNAELDMDIPILWTSVNLEELLEIKYGKDYKHLEKGDIPLYGSGGIMKYVNEALYDKESILIPRKGSLNNIIYINNPFWSVDTMFYSKGRREYFIKYLFHILNKIDFYNLDIGSAVPSMTTSILNTMIVLKPIDNIVIQFDNYLVPIFKHMDILVNETKSLFQIREVLLSKMATIED